MEHELPENIADDMREMVDDLFEWLVQPCLDFIRHECKMLINSSPIHLVYSHMRLYRCLMDEIAAAGENGNEMSHSQVGQIHHILIFRANMRWDGEASLKLL